MRPCSRCESQFEPEKWQIEKRDFFCKPCTRIKASAYRLRRKDIGRPVVSTKMSDEYHATYLAEYRKKPEVVFKNRMRALARNAVVRGQLAKGPCEFCGDTMVEAHHDDYSKPLNVRWLCRRHHNEVHLKYQATGGADE